MTAKQARRARDLHEAAIRILLPRPTNRKGRRKLERRIQKMRESI